jgi:hypothetical protein
MWPLITTHRQLVDIRIYAHDATADCRWMIYFLIFSTLMQLGMRKNGTLSSALTMLGWLGFIWYVAQSDGFTYQALPMFWSASLAFSLNGSLLWLDLARSLKLSASKKWAALFAVVVSTVVSSLVLQETQHSLAASAYSRLGPQEHDIPEATALALRYTQPGDTLLGLTQDATPFYPLITLAERRPENEQVSEQEDRR